MSNDAVLLSNDVRARRDALDVQRSFIVQAPAGSGKTELLIQRYLNLLSVVGDPEEVLAITFTRKASAEMHLRVLDALRRERRGDSAEEEHQRLTSDLAARALSRSVERGWDLLGNPKRMRILTLDSLNTSIARTQPLSAPDCPSGARVVVDAELKSVHRQAAIATLDWLTDDGIMRDATQNVLRHVDNNTELYVSYVSQMLASRDQWLPFVGSGRVSNGEAVTLRAQFEASLAFVVDEHLARTAAAFAKPAYSEIRSLLDFAAANLLNVDDGSNPICGLAGLSDLPAASIDSIGAWRGLAELLLTQKGSFRKRVDKRQGFPTDRRDKKEVVESLLADMSENPALAELLHGVRALPPIRYSDEQWDVLLALFRLLPLAVIELRRCFAEIGIADHTEIALHAGAAVGTAENPGDIALLLDYQVKHLLVDEMQDTSSAQYRMLEALTGGWQAGDGRTLFCVGDPMQSIYRFRNAEVGQFLLAREFGIGQVSLEPLLLRRNFRSGEYLVSWFNEVFPGILAAQDDPLRGAVAYAEAVPAPHLAEQGRCHVHAVFGSDPALEAEQGVHTIAQTLANHADDDMAVLVRSRTHLPQLLAELRAAGIAYSAVEIDRLTDLPETIDVLALTRAAVHQGDRLAWLAVLRAPWIGMSWTDLHNLVTNDAKSSVWELLNDAARLQSLSTESREAVKRNIGVLHDLVRPRRSQGLRDLIERTWIALGGPAVLSNEYAVENVYRYFDVLGRLERAGTLLDVAELESTLDLERVSNNGNARLQVMTMHRAKGLQFDHVLLYGLGRAPGSGDRRVLSWFDAPVSHGIDRKIISPIGPQAEVERDPVHRFITVIESEKNKHEQARLLYVACTRARKSLHLMGNVNVAPDNGPIKAARLNSLLHFLWPSVEAEYTKAFESHVSGPVNGAESIWKTPMRRRLSSSWQLPVVAPLAGTDLRSDNDASDTKVEFYWVGTEARVAGTLVHRWLQMISDERAGDGDLLPQTLQPVTLRWLREIGIDENRGRPIVERVENAVRGVLNDKNGRWILAGPGHAELALSGIYKGGLASVVLDRVRIDEHGMHWIIDYKTSSHEGGNLDGFLHAETERYRSQLSRYVSIYNAWAETNARCALYFPLLQSFIEVDV